jgi:hypothetical protein
VWVITKRKWIFTKIKGKSLPRESALLPRDNVAHYQEKVGLLPRESGGYYQEKVWVITKRKCGLLPRENVTHYQEEV